MVATEITLGKTVSFFILLRPPTRPQYIERMNLLLLGLFLGGN